MKMNPGSGITRTSIALLALLSITACDDNVAPDSTPASDELGPKTSPVAVDMTLGWCGGHGVPESVCTRCNASLIPRFKEAGDWCGEHDLPESQCELCNPGVTARWAVFDPSRPEAPILGPDSSPLPPDMSLGWCGGHGVPESVCTRCNDALIPVFQDAGDWCAEHGLPESQCTVCHPEVEARWAAVLNPPRPVAAPEASDLNVERVPRILTTASDPLCRVDTLRVRFRDGHVAQQAGIRTEPVQPRRISASINVPATVDFDATRVTRVTPRAAGVVHKIVAGLGDPVQVGDLLAVIESPLLGEAKSQYIERKQNYLLAQADADRVRTITDGQQRLLKAVTANATLDEIRQRLEGVPIGEAKARLVRAHAALRLARAEAARQTRLRDQQISSTRDVEIGESTLAAADAEFLALREELAFRSARDTLAARRALAVARAELESVERRLYILGLTDEQVQAIGAEPDTHLARHELRSPRAGRVVECRVAAGEAVNSGDVLFVVVDTATMWLLADVYERDLLLLREGAGVLFTVDGLPGVSFEGQVDWISSRVDDRTRTVRVRAGLPNDDGLLRANMFGQARLIVHDDDRVLSVPADAVQTDGCCQLVFVRENDSVFAPRKVTLGAQASGHLEILRGLQEGEVIATTGSFLLKTEILKGNIGAGCCEVDPGR